MLATISVQSSLKTTNLSIPSLPSKNLSLNSFKCSFSVNNTASSRRNHRLVASVATEAEAEPFITDTPDFDFEEIEEEEEGGRKKKRKAVIIEKPRLVLKFIWMEKNIGLGLDRELPGYGSVPLSPYYFWPRKDAWEELKTTLESKPWITQKEMIILLNQATDIINLWQQSGGNLS